MFINDINETFRTVLDDRCETRYYGEGYDFYTTMLCNERLRGLTFSLTKLASNSLEYEDVINEMWMVYNETGETRYYVLVDKVKKKYMRDNVLNSRYDNVASRKASEKRKVKMEYESLNSEIVFDRPFETLKVDEANEMLEKGLSKIESVLGKRRYKRVLNLFSLSKREFCKRYRISGVEHKKEKDKERRFIRRRFSEVEIVTIVGALKKVEV